MMVTIYVMGLVNRNDLSFSDQVYLKRNCDGFLFGPNEEIKEINY